MRTEDKIIELAAKLDNWFDSNAATFASENRSAQGRAIVRGIKLVRELDRLKKEGMAAIGVQLNDTNSTLGDAKVASLVETFAFAARLAVTLRDELLDTNAENEIWCMMDSIALALDKVGRGRAALDVLLDHPDVRVRAVAGAYLIDLDPERVVPILREIDEKGGGSVPDLRAHWTLLAWERERQSRFKSLNRSAASGLE